MTDGGRSRRALLRALPAVGIGVLSGCLSGLNPFGRTRTRDSRDDRTATARPERTPKPSAYRSALEFDEVVDAVDDLGMDPSGGDPVDDALAGALRDGTLVEFPPGEYLVTEAHVRENVDTVGMRGTGDSRRDAQFVFPDGYRKQFVQFRESGTDVLWENMTVQQTADRATGVSSVFELADGLYLHDVEFAGYNPGSPGSKINARLTDRDGRGVIDGFVCTGGGVQGTYPGRAAGIQLGGPLAHYGLLVLRNADIRNMGSSAQYFTKSNGAYRVENCYFENNDNTNIRIDGGAHPDHRCWVRNCTVVLDTDDPGVEPLNRYERTRALLAESGGEAHREYYGGTTGHGGLLVRNLHVAVRSMPRVSEGVVVVRGNHGSADFENVRILTEQDAVTPFVCEHPVDGVSGPGTVTASGINVTGGAQVGSAVHIAGRDGSTVRNSCIQMENSSRAGILFDALEDGLVANTTVSVPMDAQVHRRAKSAGGDGSGGPQGTPGPKSESGSGSGTQPTRRYGVLVRDATVDIRNVSYGGRCLAPYPATTV